MGWREGVRMEALETRDSAFSALFEQYRERILRYILRLVQDPSEADDLLQETFLRAHQKFSTLEEKASLSSWLYRIATNLCYDRFRHVSSRAYALPLEEGGESAPTLEIVDDGTPRLDKAFEQEEMSGCVQEYVDDLPDDYRAVILLHDLEGLTNPEIAEMLGCSLATAKIRLHRARKKLRAALDKACCFSRDERGVTVCERRPRSAEPDSG